MLHSIPSNQWHVTTAESVSDSSINQKLIKSLIVKSVSGLIHKPKLIKSLIDKSVSELCKSKIDSQISQWQIHRQKLIKSLTVKWVSEHLSVHQDQLTKQSMKHTRIKNWYSPIKILCKTYIVCLFFLLLLFVFCVVFWGGFQAQST